MAVTHDADGYLTHDEVASSPENFTTGPGIVVGATANLVIAMCNLQGTTSGLKFGGSSGTPMTMLGVLTERTSSKRIECWYLANPTPATVTDIEVAGTGNPAGAIALSSWIGVDLTAFAAQTPIAATFTGSPETLTTGSVAADGFAVDGMGTQWNDGTPTADGGQTLVEDNAIGNAYQVSSSYEAGAGGAVTMSWTGGGSQDSAAMAVILVAAGGGGGPLTGSVSDGVKVGDTGTGFVPGANVALDGTGYYGGADQGSGNRAFNDGVDITIAGSANLLLAFCNINSDVTKVRLGGSGGTELTHLGTKVAGPGTTRNVDVWYLPNPTLGTYTGMYVEGTYATGVIVVSSWIDVDLDAFAAQTPTTGTFNAATETLTTPSVPEGGFAVDGLGMQYNDGTATAGSGQTGFRVGSIANSFQMSCSYEEGAGAAVTMSWTGDPSTTSAAVAVILVPSAGAGELTASVSDGAVMGDTASGNLPTTITASASDGVVLGESMNTAWIDVDSGPDGVIMGDVPSSAISRWQGAGSDGAVMGDSAIADFIVRNTATGGSGGVGITVTLSIGL